MQRAERRPWCQSVFDDRLRADFDTMKCRHEEYAEWVWSVLFFERDLCHDGCEEGDDFNHSEH